MSITIKGLGSAVDSVNGKTGVVVLSPEDLGADSAGAASAAIVQHEAEADPHPQYLTETEADSKYAPIGSGGTGGDPAGTAAALLSAHEAAADPHPQYLTQSEGDAQYAPKTHSHTSSQISDFNEAVEDIIGGSIIAGAGVSVAYNDGTGKTTISASGGGGGGYAVQTRNGSLAGQVHAFNLPNTQSSYGFDAYALREETALANQTVTQETFDASSSAKYSQTSDLIWSGVVRPYVGATTPMTADGQWFSSQIRAVGAETVGIATAMSPVSRIPVMSSNSQNGYVVSASSVLNNSYHPWLAFDDGTGGVGGGVNGWASATSNTGWLQVKLPSPETFTAYSFTNMNLDRTQSPVSWTMQGSNDGVSWTIIHSVTGDLRNVRRLTREYSISSPGMYLYYRLNITQCTSSQPSLEELRFFGAPTPSLLENNGIWYTASAGTLTQVPAPSTASDFEVNGFTEFLGNLNNYPVDSFKLVTPTSGANAVVTYTPYAQIAIQSTPTSLRSHSQVNSATITATQVGNGKVRIAVSRNGTDWFAWNGTAWVVISSDLSNDTASVSTIIAAGMTPAAHNAITTAQWNTFFGGQPDQIQYAYALYVDDPVSDVASIDTFTMNVNFIAAWLKQTEAQVEIRWYPDSVTFRTVNAGNYKLAYQTP